MHRMDQGSLQPRRAEYSLLDVFSIFAVTKELGYGVNEILLGGLSQDQWAAACVVDHHEASTRFRNSESWGRGRTGAGSSAETSI